MNFNPFLFYFLYWMKWNTELFFFLFICLNLPFLYSNLTIYFTTCCLFYIYIVSI
jgi:hypothetical protein